MTTTRQIILTLTFAVFGLIACNNSNLPTDTENKTPTVDTLASAVAVINTSDNDTITYDYSYFPNDSTFSNKVLTVGTFHGDEVWDNADKEKWFGLFRDKTGFYIAETKLETQRVNDPIVDENENEKTGWEVKTANKDTSIILIEPLSFITAHKVQQAVLTKEQIFPGDVTLPKNRTSFKATKMLTLNGPYEKAKIYRSTNSKSAQRT